MWDAVEVAEFSRKHTSNVHEALDEIRRRIESLVNSRDQRRDGFVKVIRRAMESRLGTTSDDVLKELTKNGIPQSLAMQALEIARQQGAFTIFALVDALTRLAGQVQYAGDRTEADQRAASLLALAI